jgi:uncharacterized protein involved in exopolysaccharide biosynthesis
MPVTPRPGGSDASVVVTPIPGTSLRDLVTSAFYYRKMVMAIVAVGLALGMIAWILSPVRFTSDLQLLLLPGSDSLNTLAAVANPFGGSIARDVSSEVEFLHNRTLLAKVAESIGPGRINPHLSERRWLGLRPPIEEKEQINNAVQIIERSLKVTTPNDTNLLIVSFQHEDRETAIAVVDTLVDIYLQRRSEINRSLKSPFLREKAESFARQLKELEVDIREIKSKSNILDLTQEILLALNQVDTGQQRKRSESERRAGLQAEKLSTRKTMELFPERRFDFQERTDRVDNDDTDNLLIKLYLERDRLKQLYQDNDPALADVNRQIATLESVKQQPRRQFTVTREVRNPTIDFLNNHLAQVEVESAAVDQTIAEINQQIAASLQRVDQLRSAQSELMALERSRLVTEQLYRDFTVRAEASQVEEAAAALKTANIRIVANADAPLRGSSNGLNLALAIAVAGILVALAAAVAADWNRSIFLVPSEIEAWLRLPVLASFNEGHLRFGPAGNAQIIYFAGQLGFNRNAASGLQAVQVVSQGRREFRDETVAALAFELATGQNLRTLVVDLVEQGENMWQMFNRLPVKLSLSGLDIAPSDTEKMDVTVGAPQSQIKWLRANSEMFDRLFAELSGNYDIIVVNSPPLRDGNEAIRLANLVDGTVLVLRAEHTRRPAAENLVSQLLAAGGDMYGAIFTSRRLHIPRVIYRWL